MDQLADPDPVGRARDLGDRLSAAADEIERTRRFPEPLLEALHNSRLCRMLLPRSVGGDEVAPGIYLAAMEEVARHDGSVAWNLFVANSAALIAPFLDVETARTRSHGRNHVAYEQSRNRRVTVRKMKNTSFVLFV